MKATDLMIGDWFVTKKAKEMPMRIISIDKFIYGKTADGIKIGPFFAEEVVPMPLTTEILLKTRLACKSLKAHAAVLGTMEECCLVAVLVKLIS